jgi:hypothetical protein
MDSDNDGEFSWSMLTDDGNDELRSRSGLEVDLASQISRQCHLQGHFSRRYWLAARLTCNRVVIFHGLFASFAWASKEGNNMDIIAFTNTLIFAFAFAIIVVIIVVAPLIEA